MTFSRPHAAARQAFAALATSFLLTALAVPAGALSFVRVTDADLAGQAELIAEVVVRDAGPATGAAQPMTEYLVEVVDVVQGKTPGNTLKVRLHGGVRADGMAQKVYGVPELRRNERLLLFLKAGDDGAWRVLHMMQGLFQVGQTREGQAIAHRDFDGATEFELPGRTLSPEGFRDLPAFKSWLRDRAQGIERPADYELAEAALLEVAAERFSYMTDDSSGLPIRWNGFSGNVGWRAHQAGQSGLNGGGFGEFQSALAIWTNDGGSNVRYTYLGTTSNSNGLATPDGLNSIVFDDLNDSGGFDEPFNCSVGGVLARGGPWYNRNNRHTHNEQTFITAEIADIVTNEGTGCWFNSARAEEVFTHELGHTLGLGHSCGDSESGPCNTSDKNNAVMRANAHGDGRGGTLQTDDINGIFSLYGVGVQAPQAPSNLQAVAQGATAIRLTWSDNSSNEEGFRIERRTGGGSYALLTTTGGSPYVDSSVASGTTYTYRVKAYNSAGESAASNEASATTTAERPPLNVTATALNFGSIRVNWTDNSASETGFEIEARLLGNFEKVATVGPGVTQATIAGLVADSTYQFRVRAIGGLGNSSYSNVATATTSLAQTGPCGESATATCLNGERFKVEVRWKTAEGQSGAGLVAPLGSADSGLFYFFSANNWELLVKVLDGCGLNNRFWVFAAATTNVEYTLVVTDQRSGQTAVYFNPQGVSSAAATDTSAFDTCHLSGTGVAGAAQAAPLAAPASVVAPPTSAPAPVDVENATCTDSELAPCLNQERFKVELAWTDFNGVNGSGRAVPGGTADSGLLWFFSPNNWEILVKVLDGCALNGRYWVFAAATTNVGYTLKVTDTKTNTVKTYRNDLGVASPSITDTAAFATCP